MISGSKALCNFVSSAFLVLGAEHGEWRSMRPLRASATEKQLFNASGVLFARTAYQAAMLRSTCVRPTAIVAFVVAASDVHRFLRYFCFAVVGWLAGCMFFVNFQSQFKLGNSF